MDAALTDAFEANRGRLKRLAYRMLGSVSEAEDAVQDAWIRWQRAGVGVSDPAAWLVRATTRLCIDRLRAAKAERDAYRGPWLPEPLIEPLTDDPVERAEEGMDEMSRLYNEGGRELYIGQGDREHD